MAVSMSVRNVHGLPGWVHPCVALGPIGSSSKISKKIVHNVTVTDVRSQLSAKKWKQSS